MSQQTCSPTDHSTNIALIFSANEKYQQHNYHQAIKEYTQAIELHPNDALAFCGRGVAYFRLGDGYKALTDYDRAIELSPLYTLAYYRRGFLYYTVKDYATAIIDYNRTIELKPDFALAYENRGNAYRELYGEQEALVDWRFAAKLFQEQGSLAKHRKMLQLIEHNCGPDSWCSGVL